jgi:hypothetical protein
VSWLKEQFFARRTAAENRAALYADWLQEEREEKESALRNCARLVVQLEAKDQTIAALRERLAKAQPKPQDPRKAAARNGATS